MREAVRLPDTKRPMRNRVSLLAVSIAVCALAAAPAASGQAPSTDSLPRWRRFGGLELVNGDAVDRARFEQLNKGVLSGQSLLLRSASSLNKRVLVGRRVRVSAIAPEYLFVSNSAIPFSQNYGALWAGKGENARALTGLRFDNNHVTIIVAPEFLRSNNADWILRRKGYYTPPVPAARSGGGYVFPYYIGPYSIDQPMRFGNRRIRRIDPGQSTAMISGSRLEGGFSTENEWWGPGIRNAIVLSNNAPGFPHLFLRTARPLATRLGKFDFRWLSGGLVESNFFDTVSTNNHRSIASLATTLQTGWDPNLSIGFARSVYGTASGFHQALRRPFDVFKNTGHPNERALTDSTLTPGGKEQIFSLFARWVFPRDGVELYAEWARTELPVNLRDLFVAPTHTQGYTLGMQWRRPAWWGGDFRFQGELTQLEQSTTFRDRPIGSWYTSRRVVQGYTNRGEILGASIGPGASSQWLAFDYLRPSWRFGAYAGRIRWNEDVHTTANFPVYVAYCNHDVSIYPGLRAARSSRYGILSADVSFQNRMNAFFQNGGGCPNVGARVDIRNTTLSVTLATFTRR